MPKLSSIQQSGDNFLKVIENERDRKLRRDEFNRELAFRNRQLNFLDNYRQGILADQETQEKRRQSEQEFGQQLDIATLIGQGFTETTTSRLNERTGEQQRAPGSIEVGEQFFLPPIPQPGQTATKDPRVGADGFVYRWDESQGEYIKTNLKAPEKISDSEVSKDKVRNVSDQTRIDKLFGNVQANLNELQTLEGKSATDELKFKAKSNAQGNISELLEKVGLPINGEIVTKIRSALQDEDDPETRRKILNEAIFDEDFRDKLTQEQIRVLKLWIEVGTR